MKGIALIASVFMLGMATAAHAINTVSVFAGSQARDNCPVLVRVTDEMNPPLKSFKLVSEAETIPGVIMDHGEHEYLAFIVNDLAPYEKRTYRLEEGELTTPNAVAISREANKLSVTVGGRKFTDFIYESKWPRPFFYPVIGPNGARMTRGYPMDPKPYERHDHPHHQSLWVSHGDVNGHNFWHLSNDPDEQAQQKLVKFNAIESTPVAGVIDADIQWVDEDGQPVLNERRVVRIWGTPENARFMDIELQFSSAQGDVSFNDTKEGGLISLRVATSMDEEQRDDDKQGGTILNANGQKTEGQAWGQAARWCDYSGPVDGITAGFTIMDHPANLFFPTRYHVRGYGLFTANPFGLSYFIGDEHDGTQVLKEGETWRLKYRLYLHKGNANEANVKAAYANYADGVQVYIDSAAPMDD